MLNKKHIISYLKDINAEIKIGKVELALLLYNINIFEYKIVIST